jgi:hypothetical protein
MKLPLPPKKCKQESQIMNTRDTISLGSPWLSSDNFSTIATISQTRESSANIRVALGIESGRLKPVWFENTGRSSADRIFIRQVCSIWNHHEGEAKIINFAVNDGSSSYVLALNTSEFNWDLGVVEES